MEVILLDSILTSIKKLLGIPETYTNFDDDIIIQINSAFAALNQIGVGPFGGYMIEGKDNIWDDYITSCNLQMVKTYIHLKVKMVFDPPTSAALIEATERAIAELEWRLYLEGDYKEGGE